MFLKIKKIGIALVLLVFVSSIFSSLFIPQPALAGMPVTVVESIPDKTNKILTKIETGLKVAVVNAAVQGVSYFMRKIAYDTAVWLASGGKGQNPFAHTSSFGDYLSNVANQAAGAAIQELGKPFGLNLCKIPDVRMDLALRLGLQFKYAAPATPACTFTTFQKNWFSSDSWKSQYSGQALENRFNASFTMQQSDLGLALSASEKIDNLIATQKEAATQQRLEGQGYLPKTTPISGQIVTPASDIKNLANQTGPGAQIQQSQQSVGSAISSGLYQVLPSTLSLFLNTLAGTMLKNFMTKGMLPFGVGCTGSNCTSQQASDLLAQYESLTTGGTQAAQQMFSSLLVPQTTEIDRYDIMANFSNCPESPAPDNCVADEQMVQGVQEASLGNPVTIAEAMAKNWLRPDWKLIPPDRLADNSDKTCYQRAYCFANTKKLVAARIMPLGFEIAAKNSNPDKPWTLKQVVDGFNDCNYIKDANGNITGVQNDPVNKPFCHLIDPNWVLKAPPTKCGAYVYGPSLLLPGGSERAQECADLTSCVAYDSNGNCSVYGYCAREKNIWKIDADTCSSQYRTCRSFQDSTGQAVSYLYRTLDTGNCNQNNVGCSAYSLKKNYPTVTSSVWAGFDSNYLANNENSSIYFNNNLSSNCSSGSAGCSVFAVASSTDSIYLRKAPYYAKCYDTDPTIPGTQWPQTNADLAKLKPSAECSQYSQACTPDEVNCNWYSPVTFPGDNIPGRFVPAEINNGQITWNDQCDQRCVGYAAYREIESNYSNGNPLTYIIPSSGSTCSAVDAGCTGFTNLSTATNGLEQVEYYSYLRPCALPDKNTQKTFYTYEGSVVGGYQLKTFNLVKDDSGSSDQNGDKGGPAYYFRTTADKQTYDALCSESAYKTGLASPDCRQFNDDQGNVYYRLLSKTIPISDQCTPYRLNNTELDTHGTIDTSDDTCFQNGELKDGQCFYYGLPTGLTNNAGSSQACSAQADSCKAYKGNAGNNIRTVFEDNFESSSTTVALSGWSANASLSGESTHVGEHSLAYVHSGNDYLYKNLDLNPGKSYDLTFWAKGSASTSGVSTTIQLGSQTLGIVGIGDTWQYYHLGPLELGGDTTSTQLKFYNNGNLFLDNITLTEVTDYLYLVKNTLKVDPVCDSQPDDNLPGEALGCAEYKTQGGDSVFLTGFSFLCREGAIGCTALFDTNNTPDDPNSAMFNVWLSAAGTGGGQVTKTINSVNYSCNVAVGQSGCYVNVKGVSLSDLNLPGVSVATSTVFIAPDTPSTAPIYLVANQDASCNSVDLGCVNAGKVTETPNGSTYSDVLIKNDPANYDTTLCTSEAVGCNSYSYNDGIMYFKDPSVTGQKICSYADDIQINGQKYSGWFWKGMGQCGKDNTKLCSSDSDCSSDNTDKCTNKGTVPCYADYLKYGNNYGIWSYGTVDKFKNFVGECPQDQSGCTQYVDHNDSNKFYYLIDNEKLKTNVASCNEQVSQKSGCILFDQTDSPNKIWDTKATYLLSNQQNGALVQPTSSPANDANIVLKVTRDRECGEWLQCRTSHKVWDDKAGAWKTVCDAIDRCDKSSAADASNCSDWIGGRSAYSNTIFTDNLYRSRDTSWKGMDFDGYTLLGLYPVEELDQVNLYGSSNESAGWRLVKKISCDAKVSGAANCSSTPSDITETGYACNNTDEPCGPRGIGKCINNVCVQNPDGSIIDVLKNSPAHSCRAYPDAGSPFPNTLFTIKSTMFSGANYCQEDPHRPATDLSRAYACDCDYIKVNYGDNISEYWSTSNTNALGIPLGVSGQPGQDVKKGMDVKGICSGLVNGNQLACEKDSDCNTDPTGGNTCEFKKSETTFMGWRGFCLDEDLSIQLNGDQDRNACLLWWPVDKLSGVSDINNQHEDAGFMPFGQNGTYGKYYCLQSRGADTDSGANVLGPISLSTDDANQFFSKKNAITADRTVDGIRLGDLTQDNIEKVILTITNNSGQGEDPLPGTTYEIRMDGSVISKSIKRSDSSANASRMPGVNITGPFLGRSNEFVSVYGSAGKSGIPYVNEDGRVCYWKTGNCDRLGGNIFDSSFKVSGVSPSTEDAFLWPEGNDTIVWRDNVIRDENDLYQLGTINNNNVCEGGSSGSGDYGGNYDMVRVRFSSTNRHFNGIDINFCDESEGTGAIAYNVTFYLREPCIKMADTFVNTPNKTVEAGRPDVVGFTDILWKDSSISVGEGGYKYSSQQSPFASLQLTDINGLVVFKQSPPTLNACQATPVDQSSFSCHYHASVDDLASKPNTPDNAISETDAIPATIGPNYLKKGTEGSPYTCVGSHCQTNFDHINARTINGAYISFIKECSTHDDTSCQIVPQVCYGGVCNNVGMISCDNNGHEYGSYTRKDWPNGPSKPFVWNVVIQKYNAGSACNDPADINGVPEYIPCTSFPNGMTDCLPKPLTLLDPIGELKRIFAKIDDIKTLNVSSAFGEYAPSDPVETYDITSQALASKAPQVLSLGKLRGNDIYDESEPGINIKKMAPVGDKNIIISTPPQYVDLEFYAFADKDHMPLRSVIVDWDDGNAPYIGLGKYRNYRGTYTPKCQLAQGPGSTPGDINPEICVNSEGNPVTHVVNGNTENYTCDINDQSNSVCGQLMDSACSSNPQNFSQILNTTCNVGYYQASNVLHCAIGSSNWKANDPLCDKDGMDFNKKYGGCCIFKPRVQVMDNWGWCNGTCPGGVDGTTGCYNASISLAGGTNECAPSNSGAWTSFKNNIIVAPENYSQFTSSTSGTGGGTGTDASQVDLGN